MRNTSSRSNRSEFPVYRGSSLAETKALNNRKKKLHLELAENEGRIHLTKTDIDNVVTKYDALLDIYREGGDEPELPTPTELPEHRSLRKRFLAFEFIFYCAGFLLLYYQLTLYFAGLDWSSILLLALAIDVIAAILIYSTIFIATGIDAKNPASVKTLKIISVVCSVIIVAAFIAFSITRTSDASTGWDVTIFNGSLIASECGFIILGAVMSLYRDFYSWSRNHEKLYGRLLSKFNELEFEAEELIRKLQILEEHFSGSPSINSEDPNSDNVH